MDNNVISLVLQLISHILPVVITLVIAGLVVAVYIGIPYCQYVTLLSQSNSQQGVENFAKYLAQRTGGRKINVDHSWRSFVPAAVDLHRSYVNNRNRDLNS